MIKILIPLPDNDFDLTEVAVPWKLFKNEGFEIVFATENGKIAKTDPLLISGVIFGQLGAKPEAIKYYRELEKSAEFLHPITFSTINVDDFYMLHLPGGHAQGMKQYLESKVLQEKVVDFFKKKKVVGSICHGGVLLARSIDPSTGKSVVHNKKLTALTKLLEKTAYYLTSWKLGNYYRTYPEYVQDEVCRCLDNTDLFSTGIPIKPMVVEDGNLVTARWPLDAYLYAETLIKKIKK
jgi:putative intracellular protease/amidase